MGSKSTIRAAVNHYREGGVFQLSRSLSYWLFSRDVVLPLFIYYLRVKSYFNSGVINCNNVRLSLESPLMDDTILSSLILGYEEEEHHLISEYLQQDSGVLELGGGIGYISTVIDQLTLDKSDHVVVEANPFLAELLVKNKRLNRCDFNILFSAYGYSNRFGDFQMAEEFIRGNTVRESTSETLFTIGCCSLNDIVSNYSSQYDALVMDIEGAEYELIANELTILKNEFSTVIIEFHEIPGFSSENAVDRLEEAGFDLAESISDVYVFHNSNL